MNKSESRLDSEAVSTPGGIDNLSGNAPICNDISRVLTEAQPELPNGETVVVDANPLGRPTKRWCGFSEIHRLIRPNIRSESGLGKPNPVSTSVNSRTSAERSRNLHNRRNRETEPALARSGKEQYSREPRDGSLAELAELTKQEQEILTDRKSR
jgi:hypothetical protein